MMYTIFQVDLTNGKKKIRNHDYRNSNRKSQMWRLCSHNKEILSLDGIEKVNIDVEKSIVLVSSRNENLEEIKSKLSKLGYPEVGDKNTMIHKAKSFVSCAVGRLDSQ